MAAITIPAALSGQSVDDAVRTLAAHVPEWVAARTNVTVQCTNRSQTKEVEFAPACRAFARELQRAGYPSAPGGAAITLTLSESVTGKLLVAHMDSPDGAKVAIAAWNAGTAQPQDTSGRVRVDRTVLFESSTPILDFAVLQDGAKLAVLEPAAVALYARTPAGWELMRRDLLSLGKPLPREVRGRLIARSESGLAAYLPGTVCTTNDAASVPFACNVAETPWSVSAGVQARWVTYRNYLQSEIGAAYTISAVSADRYLMTSLEGPLRLAGARGELVATAAGYGSDAAAVEANCGTFAVATRASDATDPDHLMVLDLSGARFEPAGAALSTPGPVTALWPSDHRTEAHAVVRNAGTGVYEASRVAIRCTR